MLKKIFKYNCWFPSLSQQFCPFLLGIFSGCIVRYLCFWWLHWLCSLDALMLLLSGYNIPLSPLYLSYCYFLLDPICVSLIYPFIFNIFLPFFWSVFLIDNPFCILFFYSVWECVFIMYFTVTYTIISIILDSDYFFPISRFNVPSFCFLPHPTSPSYFWLENQVLFCFDCCTFCFGKHRGCF